jgi:ketosteroid isomerase-like protein
MSQKTLQILFFLSAAISNTSESGADEISRLLDEYNDALLTHDAATLERIWADDLSFVNPRGQILTKDERVENIKSGSTDLKSAEVSEKQVRMYGNSAVATLIVKINGQYSGSPGSGDFRVTTVWAKPKGTWQMVSTQMTPIVK